MSGFAAASTAAGVAGSFSPPNEPTPKANGFEVVVVAVDVVGGFAVTTGVEAVPAAVAAGAAGTVTVTVAGLCEPPLEHAARPRDNATAATAAYPRVDIDPTLLAGALRA